MTLNKTDLNTSIAKALKTGSNSNPDDKVTQAGKDINSMASDIADAIETYMKSGTITLTVTNATMVAGGATVTVSGDISGKIS